MSGITLRQYPNGQCCATCRHFKTKEVDVPYCGFDGTSLKPYMPYINQSLCSHWDVYGDDKSRELYLSLTGMRI